MDGRRIGWIDATGGISGDMLLGACLDAGVDLAVVQSAIDGLGLPERIVLGAESVQRGGLGATRALVEVPHAHHHRTLTDVLAVLDGVDPAIRDTVAAVFRVLAEAEARVHRMPVDEVHFHEVGALDSIADVVGVVAGLHALRLDRVVCSPIALGGGRVNTDHGPVPVPGPAVVELLRACGAPGFGGPIEIELATPTGVALMAVLADEFGALPQLQPELVGTGAGSKNPDGHANITRLVVGAATSGSTPLGEVTQEVVIEANVDDLDPRLWPQVLADLLAAGASDAWLTPILMKKGRPAHMLSVLTTHDRSDRLQRIVLTHTSTIGLRVHAVDKIALPRESLVVDVHGEPVRVKVARLGGAVVSAVPEYEDVARLAGALGIPAKSVMDTARAAVEAQLGLQA